MTGWGTLEPDAEVGVMKQVDAHRAVLATLKDWLPYLAANSGLPGPRGNLELVAACGEEADLERVEELLATDDEFAVVCAVVALGRHLACGDTTHLETLHGYASDARWRVREGVAMALQRAADDAPELAFRSAEQWARDDDPLVRRAAVAAVCEPRLLRERTHALRALAILSSITADLAQLPAERRRDASIRTLRQALGYGWSVVVAADPDDALPVFLRLQGDPDPDVAWIVRENGKKARLQRVLAERSSPPITPCGS